MDIVTFGSVINRYGWELGIDQDDDDEETGDVNEDDESKRYDLVELLGQFPYAWVKTPTPILSPRDIAALTEKSDLHREAKSAITAALEIAELYTKGSLAFGCHFEQRSILSLCTISFFDQDPSSQLFDDVFQIANECSDSYTELIAEQLIGLGTEKDFNTGWEKLIAGFRLLGALDRLVTALDNLNKGVAHA